MMVALGVLLSINVNAYDAKAEVDGICYYLNNDSKTATVGWGYYTGTVIIPQSINSDGITYSVTSIDSNVFYNCNLTSLTIPNSITFIGERAFDGCDVKELNIDCTEIGSWFSGKSSLQKIVIGNNVKTIGEWAFINCSGLTSLTVGNSVTSIGNYAFDGCSGLTSLAIPSSVTSIGDGAFYNCSGLTSLAIPSSVTSIGEQAFSSCNALESITVDNANTYYDSRGGCNAIIETSSNTLVAGCKNTVIPSSVTSIGYGAFYNCSGLTSVTIPSSVTSIGDDAFRGCSGLTSLAIPNSVTSIGGFAFSGCSGLTSLTIPESVTSIGDYTFSGCSGLTSLTIPESVTSIGEYAFTFCRGITSVSIPGSVASIGQRSFYGCSDLISIKVSLTRPVAISDVFLDVDKTNCTLYVPKGTAMMFMSAPEWSEFVNIVEFEEGEDAHYITIRMGDGGVLKQSVEVGQTYTYAVSADEGWEVNTLTFDGKDMTSLLLDGQFSTPVITGNSELNVVFLQKGNDVKERSAESNVKVYAHGKNVTVKGAKENAPVRVFTTGGVLVKSSVGNATLPLESGVYIIKVGNETFKVAL